MVSAKIALGAGLAILAVVVGCVLSEHPLSTLATNRVPMEAGLIGGKAEASICQADEELPRGTVAIRLAVASSLGPEIAVKVLAGHKLVASGERRPGWIGRTVTVPVGLVNTTITPVTVCLAIAPAGERVGLFGSPTTEAIAARSTAAATNGAALPGRMSIEYLGGGRSSWLELASSVASHMSLGRAWSGVWVVFFVVISMLVAAALASWLVIRELAVSSLKRSTKSRRARTREGMPRVAWMIAVVACLNAVSWSFITPPFEVPDEPSHFAYVKQLAETGTLPTSASDEFSTEEKFAISGLNSQEVRLDTSYRAIFSKAQQDQLDAGLGTFNRSRKDEGSPDAGVATSEPPLYYGLESIPYWLASSGTLLDRLQLMRLLSALIASFTALFTFLFLREALPRVRWTWSVGTLCVALSPLFGFTAGGVNPDGMLFAVSAALFYCLARAFRRGLSQRSAIATGLVIATGFLTKLDFIGLAPGAFLALTVLAARAVRGRTKCSPEDGASLDPDQELRSVAIAALVGCAPVAAYLVRNAFSNHPAFGVVSGTAAKMGGSLLAEASYIWQFYLPRLPGMVNDFPGLFTTRQIWLVGYVGRFGWLDTFFPGWVYTLSIFAFGLIAVLCARTLLARRAALRSRLSELAVYALMALGLALLVGAASYLEFPRLLALYGEARYLLPLLPLLGAVLALAARGAGLRWGPVAGALFVVLFLGHDLFSQLQVIARYYG
jgi:predicted membrane protein DUF2142